MPLPLPGSLALTLKWRPSVASVLKKDGDLPILGPDGAEPRDEVPRTEEALPLLPADVRVGDLTLTSFSAGSDVS
jgi:hypothetical protein